VDGMLERARAEWERFNALPTLSPEEMRRRREELGARQADVAMFAGVCPDTVSRAETGGNCTPETLRRIAAGLESMADHTGPNQRKLMGGKIMINYGGREVA